ncbi:MAG: hypothetical protein P8105_10630 [Dehalococcoidia bacterium]
MSEQSTQEINVPDREYLLDERIKETKSKMKMDSIFDEYHDRKSFLSNHLYEYGIGFNQTLMIRKWVWLLIKLGALYLIKGSRRLKESRKQNQV